MVLIPMTDAGEIVLVRQYRHAVRHRLVQRLAELLDTGVLLINMQMGGMLVGGFVTGGTQAGSFGGVFTAAAMSLASWPP